jgi:hypothetical protein
MEKLDEQLELDLKAYHAAGTSLAFYLLHKRFTYVTINHIGEVVCRDDKHTKILKNPEFPLKGN